jgi:hypothetical protein
LFAEFDGDALLRDSFYRAHDLSGVIAAPFMGDGTPVLEANHLGFQAVGADINPAGVVRGRPPPPCVSSATLSLSRRADLRDRGRVFGTES